MRVIKETLFCVALVLAIPLMLLLVVGMGLVIAAYCCVDVLREILKNNRNGNT